MAAGLGFKDFVTGEVLTAADVDGYLMQGVWVFADAAARDAAVTSPQEGNTCYLKDTDAIMTYSGSAWVFASSPTSYGFTAGKNKIINGDFAINQRNFTSNTAHASYNFDRWAQYNFSNSGTVTITPQTFTPGSAPVSGYEGKTFVQIVTASQTQTSDYATLSQKIEDVRTFAGQTVTVSFWAKAASGTPKIALAIDQSFGSGGSPSSTVTTNGGTVTLSTSWTRYSLTVSIPSISGKTIGTTANTSSLDISLWVSSGSLYTQGQSIGNQNNTFQIWGFQVEAGSVATAFQTATGTIQGELAACQRYYYRITITGTNKALATGSAWGTAGNLIQHPFPVVMRVAPTALEQSGTASHYANLNATANLNTCTAVPTFDVGTTTSMGLIGGTASGLVAGNATFLFATSASGFLGWSAEL
jgi:hypothetical protein